MITVFEKNYNQRSGPIIENSTKSRFNFSWMVVHQSTDTIITTYKWNMQQKQFMLYLKLHFPVSNYQRNGFKVTHEETLESKVLQWPHCNKYALNIIYYLHK